MSRADSYGQDLSGLRFGKLTVIGRAPDQISYPKSKKGKAFKRRMWYCQCDCGSPVKIIRGSHLQYGKILSCGCFIREKIVEIKSTHKQSDSRLYGVWQNMKNRCYNRNVRSYTNYGGRGITVCDEWKDDFISFSEWAYANGYRSQAEYGECTLERKDVNGPYSPENCTFASEKEQANNRTSNKYVEYQGTQYTVSQLAQELGLNYATLWNRLNNGWTEEELKLPPSYVPRSART